MSKEMEKLFEVQFQEDLKNKETELVRMRQSLAEHEEVYKEMQQVAALWKEGIPVITENCRKIDPVFEYEKMDKYWELQEKLLRLEFLRKYYAFVDKEVPHMEETIRIKKQAILETEQALAQMKGG